MATIEEVLARLKPEIRKDFVLGSDVQFDKVFETWEEEQEFYSR